MPLYLDDFIKLLAEICEERKLKAAVSESVKGGIITGVSAIIGGLLLGPVGLAIGGAVGGGASAVSAKNKFESVALVLMKLPQAKKQRLYERILYAFRDLGPTDVVALIAIVGSNTSFRDMAAGVVKNYLSNELAYKIM